MEDKQSKIEKKLSTSIKAIKLMKVAWTELRGLIYAIAFVGALVWYGVNNPEVITQKIEQNFIHSEVSKETKKSGDILHEELDAEIKAKTDRILYIVAGLKLTIKENEKAISRQDGVIVSLLDSINVINQRVAFSKITPPIGVTLDTQVFHHTNQSNDNEVF